MSKLQKDRRLFLKQLGLGAGAMVFNPFVETLFNHAQGQVASPAQKLIIFYMNAYPRLNDPAGEFLPQGINFAVDAGVAPNSMSSQALTQMVTGDWPSLMAPMAPFFNNSLIVDGVFHGAKADPGQTNHGLRYTGLNGICGVNLRDQFVTEQLGVPHGPTIDHIVAGGPSGTGTTHKSILVGMNTANFNWQGQDNEQTTACFASGAGSPVPFLSRTKAVERAMFGQDYIDGNNPTAGDLQIKTDRRKRVMDVFKDDVLRLERNVSSEYKDRLNSMLESFNTYDVKKDQQASLSCIPAQPSGLGPGDTAEDELLGMVDAATLALQCGITNVVGVGTGVQNQHSTDLDFKNNVDNRVRDRWIDNTVSAPGTASFYNSGWNYHSNDAAWKEGNKRVTDFYINILARMVENLSGQRGVFPANTTVLLVSDRGMSDGNHHGTGRIPLFIWSSNPAFQTGGRYIRYTSDNWYGRPTSFTALSDFYRTFATGFGVNLPSFGNYGGPLLTDILT